jgi:RNA recognition motif-containing protein
LKRLFGEFGPVKDVRLPIDKVTGKLRKIAFIVFEHENDVKLYLFKG